jgi:hypothetical protein
MVSLGMGQLSVRPAFAIGKFAGDFAEPKFAMIGENAAVGGDDDSESGHLRFAIEVRRVSSMLQELDETLYTQ